jgi:hypothetical protein
LGLASVVAVTVTVNTWTGEDPSVGNFIFSSSITETGVLDPRLQSLEFHTSSLANHPYKPNKRDVVRGRERRFIM